MLIGDKKKSELLRCFLESYLTEETGTFLKIKEALKRIRVIFSGRA